MTRDDAKLCLSLLTDLFPQADLQLPELSVFRDKLMQFERSDADDAIREHRLKCDFNRPKFKEILSDLYDRKRRQAPTAAVVRTANTFADIIARGNPQLAHRTPAELVMLYHRHWWVRSPKGEVNREVTLHRCALDLIETGMDGDMARRAASFVVDEKDAFVMAVQDVARPMDTSEREVLDVL